jgi:ubiquinone biosynthesis monooxygenase Coq6
MRHPTATLCPRTLREMLTLRCSFRTSAYGTSRSLYNSATVLLCRSRCRSRPSRWVGVSVRTGGPPPPPPQRTVTSGGGSGGGGWSTRARNFSVATNTDDTVYDVVIVGGGVVGATLAHQLAQMCGGGGGGAQLRMALIESGTTGPLATTATAMDDASSTVPHPRSYALSPASMALLQCNVTSNGKNSRLRGGYYQSMQVWEAGQPASLILSTRDLPVDDTVEATTAAFLGCCVEDAVLQQYLWNRLAQYQTNVTLLPSTQLINVNWNHVATTGFVTGTLQPSHTKSSTLASEQTTTGVSGSLPTIRTRLLVAADGANSALRQAAGIEMRQLDYGQTALTFTVELDMDNATFTSSKQSTMPQTRRAFQRFLPTGPLALLPTWSPHHAVIVWSTTPHEAQQWKNGDATALVDHLNAQLQMGPQLVAPLATESTTADGSILSNVLYGMEKVMETVQTGVTLAAGGALNETNDAQMGFEAPPLIRSVVSPRFTFPLQCQIPLGMTMPFNGPQYRPSCFTMGTHLAVVGDAAHTVHPLAGQGLNLGLQDVAALVECIQRSVQAGMPIGTFLLDYEQSRRHQVGLTVAGIHAVQRLFASQSVPSKHAKALGMNFIQLMGPLRRQLVQAACHGVVYN